VARLVGPSQSKARDWLRSSSALAQSANDAYVAKAVEVLRQATLGQHRGQLEGLGVMSRKATVKALTLSDHVIAVVGANAIARHNWPSESELDGKGDDRQDQSIQDGTGSTWSRQYKRPGRRSTNASSNPLEPPTNRSA
jgi:hypothetical protein